MDHKMNLCQLNKAGFIADYVKPMEEEVVNIKFKCPYKKGLIKLRYQNVNVQKFVGHRLPPVLNTFLPMILPTQTPEWKTYTGKVIV
jgi:hypothetical protein